MRRLFVACVTALVVLAGNIAATGPVGASPQELYGGPHFGAGNYPPGCIRDPSYLDAANTCYHMKAGLNALDSPKIDIDILVPASPTAERDARIMRQAVDMWDAGIHYLAPQMGLGWLAAGVQFRISVNVLDPVTAAQTAASNVPQAVTTLVDPEIVVVASNPVGGTGIGVDPVDFATNLQNGEEGDLGLSGPKPLNDDIVPCFNVPNVFSYDYWKNLPGFNQMQNGGTYNEDCNGSGGNTCFAIIGATDPAPDSSDGPLGLFNTVAHEFGHCLTLGHVGDGAEKTKWGPVAYNDIMSYSHQPAGLTKCVSSLDVETFALRMSHYLDVNGDGVIDKNDWLYPSDPIGVKDGNPFQIENPRDYVFASSTGSPLDCPQPDLGLLPGPVTQWTPTPVDSTTHTLTVAGPADGAVVGDAVNVSGTVERHTPFDPITVSTASATDPSGDSTRPYTDLLGISAEATATELHVTLHVADLPPTADTTSPVTYSLFIGPGKFDIYREQGSVQGYPASTATWDTASKTVDFHVTYDNLRLLGVRSPYVISASANVGESATSYTDDRVPDPHHPLAVRRPPADCGGPCPDGDGDGVADADDACPTVAGNAANGCPIPVTEHVHVLLDGVEVGSQAVDTFNRGTTDSFNIPITVSSGTHTVLVQWEDRGQVLGTKTLTVNHT